MNITIMKICKIVYNAVFNVKHVWIVIVTAFNAELILTDMFHQLVIVLFIILKQILKIVKSAITNVWIVQIMLQIA